MDLSPCWAPPQAHRALGEEGPAADPGTAARFGSVNGAYSWTPLHSPSMNANLGLQTHYSLVTYCLQAHVNIHHLHSSSPSSLSCLEVLLKPLSLGQCSQIKTCCGTEHTLVYAHRRASVWEDHTGMPARYWYRAPIPEWQGVSVPAVGVYLWAVDINELEWQYIIFLLFLKYLSCSVRFFCIQIFKFRQVCHWLLKHSVDFKTRFSPVQKHTVPFIPTCPAMFLSFARVLLNENVTLPLLASLWNWSNQTDTAA